MTENKRELVMYQSEDGKSRVQVRLEDGSAWLTQQCALSSTGSPLVPVPLSLDR